MHIQSLVAPLLASVSLAACSSTWKPPEIKYDDTPRQAVLQPDPPKPVQIVELAQALALAGPAEAASRAEGSRRSSRSAGSGGGSQWRGARAAHALRATSTPCKSIRISDGALYQVYAAPGQITDIALAPGEQLVGAGPVAAGDTVRWVIGDTESGTGPTKRVHILVKPTRPDLVTNLVINTDRRTYHVELRSTEKTYMASVSWAYAQDQLIALRRQNALAEAGTAVASGVDINALNFRYKIEGDTPPWRPLRAFDDGRQVFIAFPSRDRPGRDAAAMGYRPRGRRRARQLPHSGQSHDRRPAVCGSRAAAGRRDAEEGSHRPYRRKAAVMTDVSSDFRSTWAR